MPEKSLAPMMTETKRETSKGQRSAMGIGVTTLITVMVVMLLATFSVLSLVSAKSDMSLAHMASQATSDFYAADSMAVSWYSELDAFVQNRLNEQVNWRDTLAAAGYNVSQTNKEEVIVSTSFTIGQKRELWVSIAIASDGSSTIRQWQTVPVGSR